MYNATALLQLVSRGQKLLRRALSIRDIDDNALREWAG